MPARVSRRSFLGAVGASTLAVTLPERAVRAVPPRTGGGPVTRELALHGTAHLYQRPS